MERHSKKKPLLPLSFLALYCCLLFLLPLASAAPTSRSLRLRNLQQHLPSSKLTTPPQDATLAAAQDIGRGRMMAAPRMTVEVNDYPGSGANNRHNPPPQAPAPGRA